MLTFEEAVKQFNISEETLINARRYNDNCYEISCGVGLSSSFGEFMLKHLNYNYLLSSCCNDTTRISLEFTDETTKKYYPFAAKVFLYITCRSNELVKEMFEMLKPKTCTDERFYSLWEYISKADKPEEFTDFGQGIRAAFEFMDECNSSDDVQKYWQEIQSRSYKVIRKEIRMALSICPNCGSANTSLEDSMAPFDNDKDIHHSYSCCDCNAEWTEIVTLSEKTDIKTKDGVKIVPTNN